jgi:hypothetical protein
MVRLVEARQPFRHSGLDMHITCPNYGLRLPEVVDAFCPECRWDLQEVPASAQTPSSGLVPNLPQLDEEIDSDQPRADRLAYLEERVAYLEGRLNKSGLYSPSFWSRAFTVWGHWFMAYLIIMLPFFFLGICLGLMKH